jgi:hypothetical protein
MGHWVKIKSVDSRVDVHILAATSVPFTLSTVQVPNLALTHTKWITVHRKKRFTSFPSQAGMSLTKLPLGRNNSVMTSLFLPRESYSDIPSGDGNSRTFFLRCVYNNQSDCVSVSFGNSRDNDDFKNDHTIILPLCKHRQDATSLSLFLIFLLSVW